MQILEFYHEDQKSLESIQRFEINTCLLRLCLLRHPERPKINTCLLRLGQRNLQPQISRREVIIKYLLIKPYAGYGK